ncbi:MAG TPA: superoxide dismutase family protein [Rhodanobacteraceae bacterium]|nr:superoxide dismutase family protein [Rhodanobacteraceae bacterium]
MTRISALLAFASVALLAGCTNDNQGAPASPAASPTTAASPASSPMASPAPAGSSARAHAVLASASNSDVSGTLSFASTGEGVRITGRITGLKPDSTHGFHVHEHGDCSTPDASSAGGHFNPTQQPHGHPAEGQRHAGDLPNQQANAEGVATVDVLAKDVQLGTGGSTDILGGAIIVHAQPDDYSSQPSGNAGARIACGVITRD